MQLVASPSSCSFSSNAFSLVVAAVASVACPYYSLFIQFVHCVAPSTVDLATATSRALLEDGG